MKPPESRKKQYAPLHETRQRLFWIKVKTMANKKKTHNKRTKSGKSKILQATLFAIVCVLIILVLMIVELRPVKSVSSWGGPEESLALATIANKVFLLPTQTGDPGSEYITINFSAREVNAMLTMALRMYNNEKKPQDPPVYAAWTKTGSCNAECSIKFAAIYFNFYLQTIPSVKDGKIYVQVNSCRLGKFPLPAGAVEKILNQEIAKLISKDHRRQKVLPVIHS